MTVEEKKKIQSRLTALTFGVIFLMAVFLVVLAVTRTIDTLLFPVGAGLFLLAYWVMTDVLPVIWLRTFEGKTEAQKKSYCIYALIDGIGLAGLEYFIINMTTTTGVLVYVVSVFLKRRFHDEFLGIKKNEDSEEKDASEKKEDPAALTEDQTEPAEGPEKPEESLAEDQAEPERDLP